MRERGHPAATLPPKDPLRFFSDKVPYVDMSTPKDEKLDLSNPHDEPDPHFDVYGQPH